MDIAQVREQRWIDRLRVCCDRIPQSPGLIVKGRLTRSIGFALEAVGVPASVGSQCVIDGTDGEQIDAEVIGFEGDKVYLMPTDNIHGLNPGAGVYLDRASDKIAVGDALLGRVLDAKGNPYDGLEQPVVDKWVTRHADPINPLQRDPIKTPLDVGVRAINAMLTIGRGQRMGLFASAGMGKSVLLGMMTRFTDAEVIVVGLIGERGREVKEFIEDILGAQGMSKCVVVAAPADVSPVLRLRGAEMATSIAEHFRDEGKHVLLLMDSLTRFAQAQREVSLATGELPASKGYTPSVFTRMNQLIERAGNGVAGTGSITAFYTVLSEGEYQSDPIADAARAILDGHIVLSAKYADAGHYPAIDIEQSVSRVRTAVTDDNHQQLVSQFRKLFSSYQQNVDLIRVGAYSRGSDPELDQAVEQYPFLMNFLTQGINENVPFAQAQNQLQALFNSN